MSNNLLGGLGGLGGILPIVPPTTDPNGLLDGLTLTDLTSVNLAALGTTLADLAISTHGLALTLPTGVNLGGVLATDGADVVHLGANTELGSAVLGLGDDSFLAPVSSVVNGTIDGGGGNDTITVGAGDATLQGGAGNDVLTALGQGDNVLDGGAGADTMAGGGGNDVYHVDNPGDRVIEGANGGHDLVHSTINYTLGDNVEDLTLDGSSAIHGTGNALNNLITGNGAANALDGGAGDDTMVGGAGNDTYHVDSTGDRVVEEAGGGHDLVHASINYTLGSNVEDLTLDGTTKLNGQGNDLDNHITGNAADNVLYGLDGNDTIDGYKGNDTMIGGLGNDTYFVNAAGDHVVEQANAGYDTVNSLVSYTMDANVERVDFYGITSVQGIGNELANTMKGTSASDMLNGMDGKDWLIGGKGDDTLLGGTGNDKLEGGDGNDTLIGGTGTDSMTGGAGNDVFKFVNGDFGGKTAATADVIGDFTHGSDKIDLSGVDGNTLQSGSQGFTFLGMSAFTHHAGELTEKIVAGSTFVFGDTNGDGKADFAIELVGKDLHLTASDFVI